MSFYNFLRRAGTPDYRCQLSNSKHTLHHKGMHSPYLRRFLNRTKALKFSSFATKHLLLHPI